MAKKYRKLPRRPLEMSRQEIRELLGDLSHSELMRSLLMFEIERVRAARAAGETVEDRTLRSLWYTLIKPALDRLGALEPGYYTAARVKSKKDIGKVPDWAAKASKYLVELVDLGETSYEELAIIDGSRQRRGPNEQTLALNDVSIVGVHHPNLLLFTEKDTIYTVVQSIAALYGISVLSGGGKPSYAATENLIKEMVRNSNFATGSDIHVLTLTDYDPSGYIISEAVIDQVVKVAALQPEAGQVYYQRLGLEPDQLSPEEREQNTYTPASDGLKEWFERTGGVDGQPVGLELDALPISRIRALFVEGLQAIIEDELPYHRDLARALVDLLIWEALEPEIEAQRARMAAAIGAEEIVNSLTCRPDTMAIFARSGIGFINPLAYDKHIFKAADRIREKLRQVTK